MDYRRFENTYIVRLDPGEEIVEQVKLLAQKEQIKLASVQGLGALNELTVGVFDIKKKEFLPNHFEGLYEVTALTGTIDSMNGEVYCHLHMSAGDRNGHVVGGHLSRAVISATGELVITVIPGSIDREYSPEIGLNLLKLRTK